MRIAFALAALLVTGSVSANELWQYHDTTDYMFPGGTTSNDRRTFGSRHFIVSSTTGMPCRVCKIDNVSILVQRKNIANTWSKTPECRLRYFKQQDAGHWDVGVLCPTYARAYGDFDGDGDSTDQPDENIVDVPLRVRVRYRWFGVNGRGHIKKVWYTLRNPDYRPPVVVDPPRAPSWTSSIAPN